MTSINSLAERVGGASGPDRELDAEIWLAVTPGATRKATIIPERKVDGKLRRGWTIDETREACGHLIIVPAYTASIDAALTLVPEGRSWTITDPANADGNRSVFGHPSRCHASVEGSPNQFDYGATPALALTAASLMARAHTGGDDA